jgi:hypothetical protein
MMRIFRIIKRNIFLPYPPILIWFYNLLNTQCEANKKDKLDRYNEEVKRYGKNAANTNVGYLNSHNKEDTTISKDKLFEELKNLGTDQQSFIIEFKKDFEICLSSSHYTDKKYDMDSIFGHCIVIQPYIKNIDYYVLTIIICKLYDEFTLYFKIVEDTTKKLPRLPQLFTKFKDEFKNHSIDEISFFKNLNEIISVIKD